MMHKYLRLKRIKVNNKRTEAAYKLAEGDSVQLYLNDEYFDAPKEEEAFRRIKTPRVRVVYEDEHILLADKAPGMVVHADEHGDTDTLIAHIQAYLFQSGAWNPDDAASFAPALCNRIDRNTGGIVIAAKTAEALRILNDKIKDREMEKRYLCIVHGRPKPPEGLIENYLRRDEKRKQVTLHRTRVPGAKTARTRYRTLTSHGRLSLVECELLTGRTHQIRAHMASIGCPPSPSRSRPSAPSYRSPSSPPPPPRSRPSCAARAPSSSAARCSVTANTARTNSTVPTARPVRRSMPIPSPSDSRRTREPCSTSTEKLLRLKIFRS